MTTTITPLTLKQIELREIKLDLVEPFQISSGTTTSRRILLVNQTFDNGITVWSEVTAGEMPNYSPETIDTSWLIITKYLANILLNRPLTTPQQAHVVLNQTVKGHKMAKAGLEMGIWAAFAIQAGVSLSRYINGTRSSILSGVSVGIQDSPTALVNRVKDYLTQGYKKIKIKIKPGKDIEYVDALSRIIPDGVQLMVDANNAYTLQDMDVLKQLDTYNLLMIEQPLAWDDIYLHRKLQQVLKTPVCLDESITSVEKAQEMIELDSGRIINIKPGRVGGFSQSIAIHDLAQAHNIPVWCGGMLESGIGRSYNVALASLSNFSLPGDISPSNRYWKQDIVTPEWTMKADGTIEVPTSIPGLGVEVNEAMIDDLTIRKELIQ